MKRHAPLILAKQGLKLALVVTGRPDEVRALAGADGGRGSIGPVAIAGVF